MIQKHEHIDLRPYRTFGLPLLALMAVFAIAGIVATVVLSFFF